LNALDNQSTREVIQSNANHTLFYEHAPNKVAILIVYVNDAEIFLFGKYLAREFEATRLGGN
jgi:hypothetical protein